MATYTDNNYKKSGDYRLTDVILLSYLGNPINLSDIVKELNIYESIYTNCLTGNITFMDVQGYTERTPIIGKEHIYFKFRTPVQYQGDYGGEYDAQQHMFSVYNVSNKMATAGAPQLVTLEFCSPEYLRSNRLRVSKAFPGSYDGAVDAIVKENWGLNSKKPLFIEPCGFNQKYVVPNLRPLDAIDEICSRAISGKSFTPGFFFFETSQGFNFRSLDSMLWDYNSQAQTPTSWEYFLETAYKPSPSKTSANPRDTMGRVDTFGFKSNFDQVKNAREGAYASKLIAHDSFYKTFQEIEFNYGVADTYKQFPHLENFKGKPNPHSDVEVLQSIVPNVPADIEDDGFGAFKSPRMATDYVEGRTMVASDTTNIHEDMEETSYHVQQYLQKRQHILSVLKAITLTMEVPGNTHINAGQVIWVNVPAYTSPVYQQKQPTIIYDRFLTGRWLINRIRHRVIPATGEHTTVLSVSKETYATDLLTTTKRPQAKVTTEKSLINYATGSINIATGMEYKSIKSLAAERITTIKDGLVSKIANDVSYKGVSITQLQNFSIANLKSYAATKLGNIVNYHQVRVNRAFNTVARSVVRKVKSWFGKGGGTHHF